MDTYVYLIKERYGHSLIALTSFSFFYQLLSLFAASVSGIGVIYYVDKRWFWLSVIGMVVFIIFLFFVYKPSLQLASRMMTFVLKKEVTLPTVPKRITATISFYSLCNWVVWSAAFFVFLKSVLPEATLSWGFLFPVSSIVGILALFAPGGLGVREGFIVLGLTYYGVPVKDATAISLLSRVWFLIGETLFFLTSLLLSAILKERK